MYEVADSTLFHTNWEKCRGIPKYEVQISAAAILCISEYPAPSSMPDVAKRVMRGVIIASPAPKPLSKLLTECISV